MRKTDLLELIESVCARVPLSPPLIVGSQSAHALDRDEIPAVEASLAKLMAGRDKDFDFLRQLLERQLCDFTTFVQRFLLLRAGPFANAVPDRLAKLARHLRDWHREDLAETLHRLTHPD